MPISNATNVIDVESYFEKLLEKLKQQQVEINSINVESERVI